MAQTQTGWITTTTTALLASLPLQTYDGAQALVTQHLADVGGWVTATGAPADGSTPQLAASSIETASIANVQHLAATVTVELTMDMVANLTSGQPANDIIAQMKSLISNTISNQLASTALTVKTVSTVTGIVTSGGSTNTKQRVDTDTLISTGNYKHDPRAVGVAEARRIYALDNTWSIASYYTEANKEIVVTVRKYTNSSLSAIDSSMVNIYMISIQPDGYTIIGGTKLTTI